METIAWSVDWNPEVRDDARLKREVLRCFKDLGVLRAIKAFAERATKEAREAGLETEHILWLEGSSKYALYVRVWFETSEDKVFIVIEENDLGDVGFFLLDSMDCATYGEDHAFKVDFNPKFTDPGSLGVSR